MLIRDVAIPIPYRRYTRIESQSIGISIDGMTNDTRYFYKRFIIIWWSLFFTFRSSIYWLYPWYWFVFTVLVKYASCNLFVDKIFTNSKVLKVTFAQILKYRYRNRYRWYHMRSIGIASSVYGIATSLNCLYYSCK